LLALKTLANLVFRRSVFCPVPVAAGALTRTPSRPSRPTGTRLARERQCRAPLSRDRLDITSLLQAGRIVCYECQLFGGSPSQLPIDMVSRAGTAIEATLAERKRRRGR
jgi:hypothetical protein